MADIDPVVLAQVAKLTAELDKRSRKHTELARYVDGGSPLPSAVVRAKVTRAYRNIMGISEAPWADLVVSSSSDRLEVAGIRDNNQATADVAWGHWQDNAMDLESKIAQNSILMDGRAYAMVWREPGSKFPEVTLDSMASMIVEFEEGSRRKRKIALR